jgi:aspartyl-tRNA(Asn)/glutamyl-tRNA(Gln) amidotransferase subunit A
MTRTVRDAALLLDAVAGGDDSDRLSWSSGVDYLEACEGDLKGLRVAWSPTLGYASVAPDVRAAAERAARRFEDLGCIVEEVDPGLGDPWEIAGPLWTCAMGGMYANRLAEVGDKLDYGFRKVVERAARYTGSDVFAALQARSGYYEGMRAFMAGYDLLLTPTLPVTAFDAGLDEPPRTDGRDETPLDWTPFTYPFNLTGQPAATVPCGFGNDGLPVGLQIVGRWKRDDIVLRASACFEEAAPWREAIPVETPV